MKVSQITLAQLLAARKYAIKGNYSSLYRAEQTACKEDYQAVAMTKGAFVKLAWSITEKRIARAAAKRPASSLRKQLAARINAKLTARFAQVFPYRQPSSDWVEVKNNISAQITPGEKSLFKVIQSVVYHDKHNWKANQTRHSLDLNPLDTFVVLGGLLTIYLKADAGKAVIPCTWYEQTRGFEVRAVAGFLVGDFHIEAADATAALEVASKRASKARAAAANRKMLAEKADETRLSLALVHRTFGFCQAGIRSFCEVNGIDPKGTITLGELRQVVVANRALNCAGYHPYLTKLGIHLNCK